MVVEITLDVTREEFFNCMLDSLLADVQQTKPKKKMEDLRQGFEYEKTIVGKMNQKALCKVTIEKLIPNEAYVASFVSERGITTIAYELVDNQGQTDVRYEETFSSEKGLSKMNYNLVSKLFQKSSRKRKIRMFRQMEAFIQERRGN